MPYGIYPIPIPEDPEQPKFVLEDRVPEQSER